jgi:hypothetical protein
MEFVGSKLVPYRTTVMYPSSHDIFPEFIAEQTVTLWGILKRENKVLIVSKPRRECIKKIIDWLDGNGEADTGPVNLHPLWRDCVEFRFSITSATNEISLRYEPGAPLPQERVDCLKMVLDAGFQASVSMEPYLEDPQKIFDLIDNTTNNPFRVFGEKCIKEIWIGKMNYGVPPELKPLYARKNMEDIYERYRYHSNIYWKDSFQKVLHINARGGAEKETHEETR